MNVLALYVPACPFRLLPPQQLARQPGSNPNNGAFLTGARSAAQVFYEGHEITFPYDESSQLPIAMTAPGIERYCSLTFTQP
jgi:hypothetical protein